MKNATETPKEIRDLWRTPPEVFAYYNRRFNFLMDVAASDEGHLCDSYFTEKTNAFAWPWPVGAVWCNPPYSKIAPWVAKAAAEAETGTTTVFLVNADNSVGWFSDLWDVASEIHLISGRIGFIRHDTGKPTGSNMRPQMVAVVPAGGSVGLPFVKLVKREELK